MDKVLTAGSDGDLEEDSTVLGYTLHTYYGVCKVLCTRIVIPD